MSDHSIDELKRQYEAAVSNYTQAMIRKTEAGKRYTEKAVSEKLASFAARGIVPGAKVVLVSKLWTGETRTREAGFLGVEAGYSPGSVKPVVSRLKKDGTPSKAKWQAIFDTIEPFDTIAQKAEGR